MKLTCTRPPAHRKILSIVQNRLSHHLKCPKIKKIIMFRKDKDRRSPKFDLTLKRPRLADWHEFARLTQGNSLASVLPSAFWAQDRIVGLITLMTCRAQVRPVPPINIRLPTLGVMSFNLLVNQLGVLPEV